MGLFVGGTPVRQVYVGSTPVKAVYVGTEMVWSARETVQITLDSSWGARDQLRQTLSDRGLDYRRVTEIPFDIELVGTGSVKSMFNSCSALVSVPNMDTSQVTDMAHMFSHCQALTTVPEMDTSSVTSMESMFNHCVSLTSVPDLDTSQVTNMSLMFSGCSSLTHVPDMDTSNVTNMTNMFSGCAALTDGNVRLIGRHPNVVTTGMIEGSGLTKEPIREVVQITLDSGYGAQNQLRRELSNRGFGYRTITEVPFDIELVGNGSVRSMFDGCSSLAHAPAMDTSQVTNMRSMFNNCSSLTHVPDMDTSQVTDVGYMFYRCSSLTDGNVRLLGKHPNVSTSQMIGSSGLTFEPWHAVGVPPDGVYEVSLTNLAGSGTVHPLVEAIPPVGETWSVRIQGTVTWANTTVRNQPFFRIGATDTGKYGPGEVVDFSGTVTLTNSVIALVTNAYVSTDFSGTVTIES